jgi:hypothetical protein
MKFHETKEGKKQGKEMNIIRVPKKKQREIFQIFMHFCCASA